MRILLVSRRYPPAPGGVEYQLSEIARRLTLRGHNVAVYCSDLYSEIPFRRLASPKGYDHGVIVHRFKAIPIPGRRNLGTILAPNMLAALIRRHQFEIIHWHGLNLVTLSASLLLRRVQRCKIVCTLHSDPDIGHPLVARFLGELDGLVALTEFERIALSNLSIDDSKIAVIPNGIDSDAFVRYEKTSDFRKRLGITGYFVLYSGRIDARKGCDILIEAVSEAQREIGRCTILFAGPDWGSTEYLRQLSLKKGVEAIFSGNLASNELRSAMMSCDVFVLPSYSESFPVSILEAMMAGAPVVATSVGGVPSIIQDGVTGLLTSPGDPHGLAKAICRVVQSKTLASYLTASAKKVAGKYTIENTVEGLERFYNQILARS